MENTKSQIQIMKIDKIKPSIFTDVSILFFVLYEILFFTIKMALKSLQHKGFSVIERKI